ncbi:hypothetical protein FVEN_g385 [Fusarium venenatum]|uniref:Uncharacterized protein n=1 Tax=Fusarium venenatum TaxID=56646 RepID=A0A2L2SYF2_9HYPO|nr:uncharacterized protein FVRRES_07498 [Fusarium venenatum]KAG8362180.1 hypothetical protein FVEN_g385 [Fusarium venenatum]KAH6994410.1 hypothetical protein EDB82DRAFT_525489 [Fusarium venenatum]CEI63062.1 unnamed protein product [Fusarium venenatum]
MPSNSSQAPTTTTGDITQTKIEAPMMVYYIHDTTPLWDRLLIRAMAEDKQSSQGGAGYSGSKDSKL